MGVPKGFKFPIDNLLLLCHSCHSTFTGLGLI